LGCVANKYKLARKDTPAVQALSIAFPTSAPLQTTLAAVISYGGPGSWKRQALWDEYVVVVENRGQHPVAISTATLVDSGGLAYSAGSKPWALEKRSKELEKQYRAHGEAFLRAAGAGAVIVGVGAGVGAAAAGGMGYVTPAAAGAGVAAVVLLPVYYFSVLGINHHNKKAVATEFNRRRISLPLTLAPGESRTGSLFYPMVRSPRSLALAWSSETGSTTTALPLEFLQSLHVPPAPPGGTPNK
jgi:hypothetical protein